MTPPRDEAIQAALDRLLKDHSLAADTRLYREAMRESLTPTDAPGVFRLAANADAKRVRRRRLRQRVPDAGGERRPRLGVRRIRSARLARDHGDARDEGRDAPRSVCRRRTRSRSRFVSRTSSGREVSFIPWSRSASSACGIAPCPPNPSTCARRCRLT